MADPVSSPPPLPNGRSLLGFSLTSPDLVICAGSPDLMSNNTIFQNSPEILDRNKYYSTELSLDNGISGSPESRAKEETSRSVKFSPFCQTFYNKELSPDSSIELSLQGAIPAPLPGVIGINVGCTTDDGAVTVVDGLSFGKDSCFHGGDTVRTNAMEDERLSLYQTARMGNFSYCFGGLEAGDYDVALHFAEIVFTNGPPGLRVFDVFLQDKKVVSHLDIYAQVGANNPLVISDLKACVGRGQDLRVRFEGLIGSPILSAISITKDDSACAGEEALLAKRMRSQVPECESPKISDPEMEEDYQTLLSAYESQKSKLTETRKALEEVNRENMLKTKECQEAWKTLEDLQNELMRKSMHVGSLAFAVEGQVKEKSKWFSALKDLTRKLQIMKGDQIKLSEEARSYKACMVEMNGMMSIIQSTMKQQVHVHGDLMKKFVEGAKERKELYNKVLELKGNIRVFCRCRPLNSEEVAAGASMAIDFESAKEGELTVFSNGIPRRTFKFDSVFSPQANQADVFEDTAAFATSVLDGYNVCIFAYGQTGTGKTFTMEGTKESRGVNYRTLEELFHIIKEREKLFRYEVSVSVLEVYNEQIRDLLVSSSQPTATSKRLEIRQAVEGQHCVQGLVEARVNNVHEAWDVLQTGSTARTVGSTNANDHSSRSHCLHCVMVKGENLLNNECTRSRLWLVDLAGSERVAKTEVQGERLKETQSINRSLAALGDVIFSLANKSAHTPFRNSKLTHLLQDSLGGDSKTLMFVQISPNESDLSETLCSLNFASRVRGVELGPAKRQLDTSELVKYKQMAEKTKQDLKSKDVQIRKLDETVQGLELKVKEKDVKNRHLQEKIKELESQLLVERKLARQHVDTKIAEQHQHQQLKQPDELLSSTAPPAPRPPLATRLFSDNTSNKTSNESANNALSSKEMTYGGIMEIVDPSEKENNPEMAENLGGGMTVIPKRTGRFSVCPMGRPMIPLTPAPPRRNSLIPPPSLPLLPAHQANVDAEQSHCDTSPPKELKTVTKKQKMSSVMRRSLGKKVSARSPMRQQIARKGGINVGNEKVRLSIGSRGKMMAQRMVVNGSGRRVVGGMKDNKEKERGWNAAKTGRAAI
ncbi:unnamed protein product [Linum trigynum]|uniref:Kinesin motor domain-containing protein n=1 Tax=Linum trigynum TaxID=586398 RepID=A0AAV2EL79_9ROSI